MISRILKNSVIQLEEAKYLTLFIIIAAALNFLAGINIDIYAPSMPAIAEQFSVSAAAVKCTIALNVIGWGLGCFIFGALMDSLGRKSVISFGLFCFTLASLAAIWSQSFTEIAVLRFIQGFMVSAVTVGCRVLIVDAITGPRYTIAILYTSLAFSCGTVFGPFIGGILQNHFGWEANFAFFALISFTFLVLLMGFINESLLEKNSFSVKGTLKNYRDVFKNLTFVLGIFIIALSNIELLLYPTLGPFLVTNTMHLNALIYGKTALFSGVSYLMGALICRILLSLISVKTIYNIAFAFLITALFLSLISSLFWNLNLLSLMLPFIFINITVGFITPNITSTNLKIFPKTVGTAMAVQAGGLSCLTALGIFLISQAHFNSSWDLFVLFAILVGMQFILFFLLTWFHR